MSEMFEAAARIKLRFASTGSAQKYSAEDLWDLPLTSAKGVSLDSLEREARRAIKNTDESYVTKASKPDAQLQLRVDILRHVIDVTVAERDAARAAEDKRAQKKRVMELIAEKQDETLKGKSLEELKALVDSM